MTSGSQLILQQLFPRLTTGKFAITSAQTPEYNCIAWAAGDDRRWWWPGAPPVAPYYWPPDLDASRSMANFQRAYESLGYAVCADGEAESGVEKIAVYAKDGDPTHAARQLDDGTWTSKCGKSHDIMHHTPDLLGGGSYGEVAMYMARARRSDS